MARRSTSPLDSSTFEALSLDPEALSLDPEALSLDLEALSLDLETERRTALDLLSRP